MILGQVHFLHRCGTGSARARSRLLQETLESVKVEWIPSRLLLLLVGTGSLRLPIEIHRATTLTLLLVLILLARVIGLGANLILHLLRLIH